MGLQKTDRMIIWAAISFLIFVILWKVIRKCKKKTKKKAHPNWNSSEPGYSSDHEKKVMIGCCVSPPSSLISATNSDSSPKPQDWDTESISTVDIEQLRRSERFMANPLAALTEAGASNRDTVKVLKRLSNPVIKNKTASQVRTSSRDENSFSIQNNSLA